MRWMMLQKPVRMNLNPTPADLWMMNSSLTNVCLDRFQEDSDGEQQGVVLKDPGLAAQETRQVLEQNKKIKKMSESLKKHLYSAIIFFPISILCGKYDTFYVAPYLMICVCVEGCGGPTS